MQVSVSGEELKDVRSQVVGLDESGTASPSMTVRPLIRHE